MTVKRQWALLLALLLALSGFAWAEEAEVSAGQVEAQAEEAGALSLGGAEEATAPAEVAETAPVAAPAPEPADGESFGGRVTIRNKAEYVPAIYDLEVTRSVSGTMYLSDELQLFFTGPLKSLKSASSSRLPVVEEDLAGGMARLRATKEGKVKVTAKTTAGKKYTVTVTVKDPYVPTSVSLGSSFEMLVGETLALDPVLVPDTARTTYKWSTSEKKVVAVSDGVLTALREGKSKITVKTANGKKATVSVKVVDPYKPDSVSLGGGDITVNVGDELQLYAQFYPDTARTVLSWSTSKSSVASVNADGLVVARKEGKAKITVKTSNGKKDTMTVKVVDQYKPTSVSLGDITIGVNDIVALEPLLSPSTARTTFSWSTSEKKVVAVNSDGLIKGLKEGKSKITVKTANGKKARCTVKVQAESVLGVRYRALLVANDEFYWGDLDGWDHGSLNRSAGTKVKNMLGGVSGALGGGISVTCKANLDAEQLLSAIETTFAGATEDDVSLFYFASHGDSFSTDSAAGALMMASTSEQYPEYMELAVLRDALLQVPGRVVVLLDTCGSGAAVYSKGTSFNPAKALARFDEAVVRAFSEADPGVTLPQGDVVAKTGELMRANKFYVLCSSSYREDSWAYEDSHGGGSMFTDWLVDGVGKSGQMPADKLYAGNNDNVVDLYELYRYIQNVGDTYGIETGGEIVYQHVQVYPGDTRFELFR